MGKPWEKLGVSRATYFRQKSQPESQVSPEKSQIETTVQSPEIDFRFQDVTRKDIEDALLKGQKFIPNWYTAGFESCSQALSNF